MRVLAASPALSPYVRDFMVVEAREAVTRLRIPETSLVLGVRYRGGARFLDDGSRVPALSLAGISRHAREMHTLRDSAVLLARFHPGGAARFFREPLHELFGHTTSLDALFARSEVDRLQTQVGEAADDHERVAMLENFLLAHARRDADALISRAVRSLRSDPGVRIRELAADLGLSHDAFEKRFRREVGCTPKQFASLTRVHSVLNAHRSGRSLTQLALDAGYFDQSHFNREFRATIGVTPGAYLRAR